MDSNDLNNFLKILYEHGGIQFGDFTLKSGISSPIYIDMRIMFSLPDVLMMATHFICDIIQKKNLLFDCIVGVPYAALPVATIVSQELKVPLIIRRKEAKSYGAKKLIEGIYKKGDRALIIEDVTTSGKSIVEVVLSLRENGLVCDDVICILDRGQGAIDNLELYNLKLHNVIGMEDALNRLVAAESIAAEKMIEIKDVLRAKCVNLEAPLVEDWSIGNRISLTKSPLSKKLLATMEQKKTCLCLAVDYTSTAQILRIVEKAASFVCAIKLHVDIIEDFSVDFIKTLSSLSETHNFIILEDRKFADTGNTVELQICKGYNIYEWAHAVTLYAIPGPSILSTIERIIEKENSKLLGCILVAELSSKDNLLNSSGLFSETVAMAKKHSKAVGGFICQKRCLEDPSFLYCTPGVHLERKDDGKGQQWRDIRKAIIDDGNDIIIVGRAITEAECVETALSKYRDEGWKNFIERIKMHAI